METKEMSIEEFQKELAEYEQEGKECSCDDKIEYNPLVDPITMDDNAIEEMCLSNEFKEGLKKGSYFAGMFTALINSGIDILQAHDFVTNEIVAISNQRMGELQVEVAKYNYLAKDSQEV